MRNDRSFAYARTECECGKTPALIAFTRNSDDPGARHQAQLGITGELRSRGFGQARAVFRGRSGGSIAATQRLTSKNNDPIWLGRSGQATFTARRKASYQDASDGRGRPKTDALSFVRSGPGKLDDHSAGELCRPAVLAAGLVD